MKGSNRWHDAFYATDRVAGNIGSNLLSDDDRRLILFDKELDETVTMLGPKQSCDVVFADGRTQSLEPGDYMRPNARGLFIPWREDGDTSWAEKWNAATQAQQQFVRTHTLE